MPIRIGLIGAGRMGSTLAQQISRGVSSARLVAVADPWKQHATRLASQLQLAAENVFNEIPALLSRDDLDAVVIATPTNTHVAVVQAAATAGKHIFVEKPLALTLEECNAAIAAVQKAGVKMMVGFMRRYDAAYLRAREVIESGEVGNPVMIKLVGRDMGPVPVAFAKREVSGGLIADMAIHDFDLARWLMNDEVVRVHSEGTCLVYPELGKVGDIDNAVINLRFANGAIGNVDVSRNAIFGYDVRSEVVCSKGTLMIGVQQQTPLLVLKRNNVSHDAMPGFMERFGNAYATEIADFVDCIASDRPVPITGEDARAATAIAIAATQSLDEQRAIDVT